MICLKPFVFLYFCVQTALVTNLEIHELKVVFLATSVLLSIIRYCKILNKFTVSILIKNKWNFLYYVNTLVILFDKEIDRPEIDGSSLVYKHCYRNVGLYTSSFVNFGLIYQCKVSSISKFDYVGIWIDCRGGSSMHPQVISPHFTHSFEIFF